MKNLLTCFVCLLLTGISLAQQEGVQGAAETTETSLLPKAGDLGITVNMTGLISNFNLVPRRDLQSNPSFTLRYVRNEKLTYRIGVSPRLQRNSVLTTDSIGKDLVQFDSTFRQASLGLRPGVEFHFTGTRRLDPYMAIDGEFGFVGGTRIGSVTTITDTTGTSRIMRTITQDGGFSFGAKLSAGLNYFVAERWSFGMEYGLGVYHLVSGGDRQAVVQIEPVSGSNITQRNLSSARASTTTMLVDPMVQFTISYFFKT